MQKGTVKFFNEAKGFGFIAPSEGSVDIFVHTSGLVSISIHENDQVIFNVQRGDRGLNAISIKLA